MKLPSAFIDPIRDRFGSARFANQRDLRNASLFDRGEDPFYFGEYRGRPLFYNGPGGVLLTAGARGGKLRDILSYNICTGIIDGPLIMLDPKGEGGAISQNQIPSRKKVFYWNPLGLHGLPKHRLNPVGHIRRGSPTVVPDIKVFCENTIVTTGSANGDYFERRAREYLEAICLVLVEIDGVLTLPRLYWAINLIPVGGDDWLAFGFHMYESEFEIARRVESEIANARENDGSGFQGICGELFKSFAALSDPVLMESVSPPFDVSIEELIANGETFNLYLIPPAEFIGPWASVIKAFFVAAMVSKSRAPSAPRETLVIDECSELKGFPAIERLFSYGAGIGIRPVAVYQSTYQMKANGRYADH